MPQLDEEAPTHGPVMTFRVGPTWLAAPVALTERIVSTPRLVPVPLADANHAGLMELGDRLVPVMSPGPRSSDGAQLVAVLEVRGEPVGLCIDAAGRVHDHLRPLADPPPPPASFSDGRWHTTGEQNVWLINPDRLWLDADGGRPNAQTA